jgi:hypothetical protein
MTEPLTAEEEKALEQVSQFVATELAEGKSKDKVIKQLVKKGIPEVSATQLVFETEQMINQYKQSFEGRRVLASKYARHMLYGILWALGGTIITGATFIAAASRPSGGRYIVAYGAIIFGIVDFFRGLFGWLKHRD